MANTMLRNQNESLMRQIERFAENIGRSGKSPEMLLNELVSSGRFTADQVEQAKKMAEMFLHRR